MYQLCFRNDLQGFGRVLLAMSVEGREGRNFYAGGVRVESEKCCVLGCSQVIFVYSVVAAARKRLQRNDNRSRRRIHKVFSPCFAQCLNNALANGISCQSYLQRSLTVEIFAR